MPRAKTPKLPKAAPISDADALAALAHAHDQRMWGRVVEMTDAWLDARGTLPALAAQFRSMGLQAVGRYDEAVLWGAVACKAIPVTDRLGFVASRTALAQAFARIGDHANAMRLFRAALKVPVDDPFARTAQAHLRLSIKPHQWPRAWQEHETRIGTEKAPVIPNVPVWDGGPTDGPVVVLHEQGLGDAVLFARYLPWVAETSGHSVIWAGPTNLHRWIDGITDQWGAGVGTVMAPTDALLEPGDGSVRLARGACIVRAMSLPALHKTTPETVPPPVAPRIPRAPSGSIIRVGVCWQGAAQGHHDFERTIPPETFALLWEPPIPHVEYVNLQYNTPAPAGAPFGPGNDGDVYASAQRIASCDLVVSVDTSTVHLAGSLGVPTICLTPSVPDWRYPAWPHGTDTPWYPSVVVVRRDKADAAADQVRSARAVAEGMVDALRQRAS